MNKLQVWFTAGMITASVLFSAGCSTSGMQAGDSTYTDSPYLVVDDPVLADQVSIVKVGHDMVGDMMRAQASLKSNRDRSLQLQYRFSWYDANGMEIDTQGKAYRDIILEGKDAVSVTSMAPSPAAQEFKIRVRKVKAFKIDNIK